MNTARSLRQSLLPLAFVLSVLSLSACGGGGKSPVEPGPGPGPGPNPSLVVSWATPSPVPGNIPLGMPIVGQPSWPNEMIPEGAQQAELWAKYPDKKVWIGCANPVPALGGSGRSLRTLPLDIAGKVEVRLVFTKNGGDVVNDFPIAIAGGSGSTEYVVQAPAPATGQ